MLLSDANESLSSIKSLINPDCIKSSSVTTALFQESIRLKLKLFDAGDRLPDFANVAHALMYCLWLDGLVVMPNNKIDLTRIGTEYWLTVTY